MDMLDFIEPGNFAALHAQGFSSSITRFALSYKTHQARDTALGYIG